MRLREVRRLVRDHTASKKLNLNLNPAFLAPETSLFVGGGGGGIRLTKGHLSHLQIVATQKSFLHPPPFPPSPPSPSPAPLRASLHGPAPRMEDQGFHLLIPIFLSLILLALLGLLVTRVIQRKKGEPSGWVTESGAAPRAQSPPPAGSRGTGNQGGG